MNSSLPTKSIKNNQSGLVSIIVTMMLMLVITLITLTFAKITRREQRQSLDRQLNTQAFYAAESGVNAAAEELKSGSFAKTQCNNPLENGGSTAIKNLTTDAMGVDKTIIDGPTDVAFTCLTIDPEPSSLEYQNVGTEQSTVIPIKSNGGNIDKINVSWQEKSGSAGFNCAGWQSANNFGPSGTFPAADCKTGILRLDIVPTNNPTRANLANSKTVFLIASDSGGSNIAYPSLDSGDKRTVRCSSTLTPATPKFCNATINMASFSSTEFYLRAISIYASSSVTISADNGPTRVGLIGAQTIIDSTGRAGDILRRIQVRLATGSIVPDFALQSTDTICKRLKIESTAPFTASIDNSLPVSSPITDTCQIP